MATEIILYIVGAAGVGGVIGYFLRNNAAQKKLDELEAAKAKEIQSLKSSNDSLRESIESITLDYDDKLEKTDAEFQLSQAQLDKLQSDFEETQANLKAKREAEKAEKERASNLAQNLDSKSGEISRLESELLNQQKAIEGVTARLDTEAKRYKLKVDAVKKSRTEAQRQLRTAQQRVALLESSLTEKKELIERIEEERDDLKSRLSKVSKSHDQGRLLKDAQQRATELSNQLQQADKDAAANVGRIQEMSRRLTHLESIPPAAPSDSDSSLVDELKAKVEALQAKLASVHPPAPTEADAEPSESASSDAKDAETTQASADTKSDESESAQTESSETKSSESNGHSNGEAKNGETKRPAFLLDSEPSDKDDLKKIRGIGKKLEKTLNKLGIYQYAQLAKLSDADIDWIGEHIDTFPDRIKRDEWVSQAKSLQLS